MTKHKLIAAIIAAVAFGGFAVAADEAKIPQTAEEHLALAKSYEEKAAMWRDEAAHHRVMADQYKKFSKTKPNPRVAEMEKHCSAIVKESEKLAAEADASAKLHRQAAKELEPAGKGDVPAGTTR